MKVTKMSQDAIPLLVSYGVGCIDGLVKDGNMAQSSAKNLVDRVFSGKPLTESDARSFKIAYARCAKLASSLGKDSIDAEVVHTYFFDPSQHNRYVDLVWSVTKDFDPVACKAQVGTVLELSAKSAVVATEFDGRTLRLSYMNHINGLQVDDKVVVHRGHIAEKMSTELADLIRRLKSVNTEQRDLLRGVFKSKDGKEKRRIRS
jgi:hypothetical protein